MAQVTLRPVPLLVVLSREALHMTQSQFAQAIGTSVRTLSRWEGGRSEPAELHYRRLAQLVHPVAEDLAREAAARGAVTPEQLGLVATPAAPAAAPEPSPARQAAVAPPASPSLPVQLLLDAVVCSVASALEKHDGAPVPRARARAAVAAAFASAHALRLEIAEVDAVLAPASREVEGSRAERAGVKPGAGPRKGPAAADRPRRR